ncbi:uncharacterized protein LOC131198297 [Ahaetulla prasina]|uniref:uncharacterized protein LOC131198297 n=1 Tax=Ahaetulla prasina TaxID=499056 RepID=UPI00264949D2|nr:uncharacterized protein LOC131198297 [Ahaetulla prasina]
MEKSAPPYCGPRVAALQDLHSEEEEEEEVANSCTPGSVVFPRPPGAGGLGQSRPTSPYPPFCLRNQPPPFTSAQRSLPPIHCCRPRPLQGSVRIGVPRGGPRHPPPLSVPPTHPPTEKDGAQPVRAKRLWPRRIGPAEGAGLGKEGPSLFPKGVLQPDDTTLPPHWLFRMDVKSSPPSPAVEWGLDSAENLMIQSASCRQSSFSCCCGPVFFAPTTLPCKNTPPQL